MSFYFLMWAQVTVPIRRRTSSFRPQVFLISFPSELIGVSTMFVFVSRNDWHNSSYGLTMGLWFSQPYAITLLSLLAFNISIKIAPLCHNKSVFPQRGWFRCLDFSSFCFYHPYRIGYFSPIFLAASQYKNIRHPREQILLLTLPSRLNPTCTHYIKYF